MISWKQPNDTRMAVVGGNRDHVRSVGYVLLCLLFLLCMACAPEEAERDRELYAAVKELLATGPSGVDGALARLSEFGESAAPVVLDLAKSVSSDEGRVRSIRALGRVAPLQQPYVNAIVAMSAEARNKNWIRPESVGVLRAWGAGVIPYLVKYAASGMIEGAYVDEVAEMSGELSSCMPEARAVPIAILSRVGPVWGHDAARRVLGVDQGRGVAEVISFLTAGGHQSDYVDWGNAVAQLGPSVLPQIRQLLLDGPEPSREIVRALLYAVERLEVGEPDLTSWMLTKLAVSGMDEGMTWALLGALGASTKSDAGRQEVAAQIALRFPQFAALSALAAGDALQALARLDPCGNATLAHFVQSLRSGNAELRGLACKHAPRECIESSSLRIALVERLDDPDARVAGLAGCALLEAEVDTALATAALGNLLGKISGEDRESVTDSLALSLIKHGDPVLRELVRSGLPKEESNAMAALRVLGVLARATNPDGRDALYAFLSATQPSTSPRVAEEVSRLLARLRR